VLFILSVISTVGSNHTFIENISLATAMKVKGPVAVLIASTALAATAATLSVIECKEFLMVPSFGYLFLLIVSYAHGSGSALMRTAIMLSMDLALLLNTVGSLIQVQQYSQELWGIYLLITPSMTMLALTALFVMIGHCKVRLDWVMLYTYCVFLTAALESLAATLYNFLESASVPASESLTANYWLGAEFQTSMLMNITMLVAAYFLIVRRFHVRLITSDSVTVSV
jgi:hypothetical protein